MEKTVKSVKLK